MSEEYLDIVNERDEVIGRGLRKDLYANKQPMRIAHIFVENDEGKILLQVRSRNVKFKPGAWVTSAAGHVQSGETYEQAGHREMLEELGVDAPLTMRWTDRFDDERGFFKFMGTFTAKHNGPFLHEDGEVESVAFFSLSEIQNLIDRGDDFHPELLFLLVKHFGLQSK